VSIERARGMTSGSKVLCVDVRWTDAMHSDGDGRSGEAGEEEQYEQQVFVS
jgi:hypothetical protein